MCMLADCSGRYFRMEMMANIELGKWPEAHSMRNSYNSLFKQCFGFEILSYIIYYHGRSDQN